MPFAVPGFAGDRFEARLLSACLSRHAVNHEVPAARPARHAETVGGHIVASVLHARSGERARDVLARLETDKPSIVELAPA